MPKIGKINFQRKANMIQGVKQKRPKDIKMLISQLT
jgi:hypothetical protein